MRNGNWRFYIKKFKTEYWRTSLLVLIRGMITQEYRFWSRHSHCSWLDQKRWSWPSPIYYSGQFPRRSGQVQAKARASPGKPVQARASPHPARKREAQARYAQLKKRKPLYIPRAAITKKKSHIYGATSATHFYYSITVFYFYFILNIQVSHHLQIAKLIKAGGVWTA